MATNASLSNQISESTGLRYALALLATVVALLARLGLNPFLGDYVPYITLFPAVAFCAWYCGLGPSILSVVVAVMGAKYLFIPPTHSLRIVGMPQVMGILISCQFPVSCWLWEKPGAATSKYCGRHSEN